MKILQLHVNWIEWEPVAKEIPQAEEITRQKYRVEDALALLITVEKGDNQNTARKAVEEVVKFSKKIKVSRFVIYPYAHLGEEIASPKEAYQILVEMEKLLRKLGFEVHRAPFGWNKALALSIKAHPLAESSRKIIVSEFKERKIEYHIEPLKEANEIASHLIARAVKKIFPEAKLGDFGEKDEKAYYDIKFRPLTKEDVKKIEEEVEKIKIKQTKIEVVEKDKAKSHFSQEPYKQKILDLLPEKNIKIIRFDNFSDIIKTEISEMKKLYVKILNTSSSYSPLFKDNFQRIWFVAFENQEELKDYLKAREEAQQRDHRVLGEKLDLFHIEEEIIGSGLPLIHPKGMIIRNELIRLIREINKSLGFNEIWTPHLSRTVLWKISGHYEKYRDKMFIWEMDGEEWGLKPMNCPMHLQIYKFKPRSYKDLPIRYAEFATVYRKEQSGELHGLARVWSLTQDDHHLLVLPSQIKDEIKKLIEAVIQVYNMFGFKFKINLSTKPEKYIGDDVTWDLSEKALKDILSELRKEKNIEYEIKEGEGAFYGPKIDFDVKDALGRWWQLGTIQLDFFMPKRFNVTYTDSDGKEKYPIMIHFALLGSLERFMAMLIEHFKGRLPLWLSPTQVRILPLSDKFVAEGKKLVKELENEKIRVDIRVKGTLNSRIREAEEEKIPYIVVIGKKELSEGTLSVRFQGKSKKYKKEEFIKEIKEKIAKRSLS